VRLHIRTFSKSDKKEQSHNRSFKMGEFAKMCKKSAKFEIALLLYFKKIAQMLFQKGRMCKNVQKSAIMKFALFCTFAHFGRATV